MADKIYATLPDEMELDIAILRLKELGKVVSVTDILKEYNVERIVEILQIIERINVPMRMEHEGEA